MEKIKSNAIFRKIASVATLVLLSVLFIFTFSVAASESEAELSIDYCNLSFRDRVTIKYAVDSGDVTDVKLLIWTEKPVSYTYGTQKYVLESVGKSKINGKDYMTFDFNELSAKQMTDTVYAVAYVDRAGVQSYSAPHKYSILQYAYNTLGKTKPSTASPELISLLENMLEYGAAAQLNFDYHEERLANADYYQVVVDGGVLADGFNHGLFLEGEIITLSAPPINDQSEAFSGWIDPLGSVISTDSTATYTVGNGNVTILASYSYNVDGIQYNLKSDETYEVVGYNGSSKYLYVPEQHEGKAVTSVKTDAFANNKVIEYLSLPDTVSNVGNRAFKNCSNLKSINLGKGLEVIGNECFCGTAITELVIPDSVKVIGHGAVKSTPLAIITLPFIGGSRTTSNAYLGYIFGGSSYGANASVVPATLGKVILSDAVSEIPAFAFYGCSGIDQLIVGSSVEKIGNNAFYGMTDMDSIYLPASVISVPANAEASASPFYGCDEDLMIVLEKTTTSSYGKYWNYITESKETFTVYMKTYDDYVKNADSYRTADPSDASLSALLVDGNLIDGFYPDVYSYTVNADINEGYGTVTAAAASAAATVIITNANADNGGVATIRVTSKDGQATKIYTVTFELTGSFNASAEVVNKNDAQGTVTFVIDDGDTSTATFANEMLTKYRDLKITYAIIANRLATLNTELDSSTGKYNYVTSPNGKYTYTENSAALTFWRNILENERAEVISHTYTHAFPGINDDGGIQDFVNTSGNVTTSTNLPVGSATAEIYAAIQILEELLEADGRFLVEPGTDAATTDKTVNGVTYKTYYTYYKALLQTAIENNVIIGGRGTVFQAGSLSNFNSYVITKAAMADVSVRNSIHAMMVRPFDNTEQWKTYVDNANSLNGWAVFCIHKISESATSGHYILEDAAEELFAYTAGKNVWIANYSEASLYYSEWSSASVSTEYNGGSISVTLTDNEDNAIFNEALTVKVSVPASWSNAVASGTALEILTNPDGSHYVLADIVPDSGTVTVSAN